ncbi:MAG: hypothetical protein EHM12_07745 [Dehalococcoidia bacterium]|nr:MAG: hypothetical protein EHM12_07745 [Dehalococcoidia bacterium]
MTKLDYFNECLSGGYNNTPDYISWKIVNRVLYLQCSREKEDWLKNIDIRPVDAWIGRNPCLVPNGFDDAVSGIMPAFDALDIDIIVGYSHGAAIAALLSGMSGLPALAFACPKFIFRPDEYHQKQFYNLQIFNNKGDLVSMLPPFYSYCGHVNVLKEKAVKEGTWWEWYSRHSPNRYRQNLEGV